MRASAGEPLRAYALGLPEAYEDHPWGENVAKVGKKVFVFFGQPDAERPFGLTVKLPESSEMALSLPWATSPGYGLDRGPLGPAHPARGRAARHVGGLDR